MTTRVAPDFYRTQASKERRTRIGTNIGLTAMTAYCLFAGIVTANLRHQNDEKEQALAGLGHDQNGESNKMIKAQKTACKVTTYSDKYDDGKHKNRDGTVYRHSDLSVAVGRNLWPTLKGKTLTVSRGKYSASVVVRDTLGAQTGPLDLRRSAWQKLFPGLQPGKEKAFYEVNK